MQMLQVFTHFITIARWLEVDTLLSRMDIEVVSSGNLRHWCSHFLSLHVNFQWPAIPGSLLCLPLLWFLLVIILKLLYCV